MGLADPPVMVGLRVVGLSDVVVVGLRVVGLDVGDVWHSEGLARTAIATKTAAKSKWRIFIFIKWDGKRRVAWWITWQRANQKNMHSTMFL